MANVEAECSWALVQQNEEISTFMLDKTRPNQGKDSCRKESH